MPLSPSFHGARGRREAAHARSVHIRPCAAVCVLPARSRRCTLVVVSPLENIVEDLKALPPATLEVAADIVHRLKRISEEERQAILTRTAGALSLEEADELNRSIDEGCERIDESGW